MSRLVSGVRDDQLNYPNPCPEWTVADLLAHVHQFAVVFTHNARKKQARPPEDLVDDWRVAIPDQLDELARAWRETSAWQGRVSVGGVEMDAPDNAVVGIEELTVHGWDLARATSQDLRVDDARLDQVDEFFEVFAEQIAAGGGRSVRRQARPSVQRGSSAPSHARAATRRGRQPVDGSHRRICKQRLMSFRLAAAARDR
jgi:uncharacterized protein (TIGR03086 family)